MRQGAVMDLVVTVPMIERAGVSLAAFPLWRAEGHLEAPDCHLTVQ